MRNEECRRWREQIGALVIGGLDDGERAAIIAHLDGCASCRAEAESLAGTAGLLDLVDSAHLDARAPRPPEGLGERIGERIAEETRRRRRRRSGIFAGATAGLAAAAVLIAIVLSAGSGTSESRYVQNLAFSGLPAGVRIQAGLEPGPSGTEIHMRVGGIRSGTLCRVFVRRNSGALVPAGSFRYLYEADRDSTDLTTAVDLADVRAVIVRAGPRSFYQPLPAAR